MSPPPIQPIPVIMTTEQVAELLHCSTGTVERYVFRHRLVAVRIGRERRFRADDVLDFIASRPTTDKSEKRPQRRRTGQSGVSLRR